MDMRSDTKANGMKTNPEDTAPATSVTSDARELLPCPWCGASPSVFDHSIAGVKDEWSVYCKGEMCAVAPSTAGEFRQHAVSQWNNQSTARCTPAIESTSVAAACDCHSWPTVKELHDYVEYMENQMRAMRPEHQCKPIARAVMDKNRDWWIGELLEPVPEWPKETHCLHMRSPLKTVVFLCNGGDFEQLLVMSNTVTHLRNLEWLDSATEGARIRAAPAAGDTKDAE